MFRTRWVALLILLAGCQGPEKVQVMPLPAEGEAASYADVVQRARAQATTANEFFYVDNWPALLESADALEKTARYLLKSNDVPAGKKDALPGRVEELVKLTGQLRDAAKAQDVKKTNDVLQQINLKVRELRPDSAK